MLKTRMKGQKQTDYLTTVLTEGVGIVQVSLFRTAENLTNIPKHGSVRIKNRCVA
jgi:hypothetical protein